eukprot:gene3485-3983_t
METSKFQALLLKPACDNENFCYDYGDESEMKFSRKGHHNEAGGSLLGKVEEEKILCVQGNDDNNHYANDTDERYEEDQDNDIYIDDNSKCADQRGLQLSLSAEHNEKTNLIRTNAPTLTSYTMKDNGQSCSPLSHQGEFEQSFHDTSLVATLVEFVPNDCEASLGLTYFNMMVYLISPCIFVMPYMIAKSGYITIVAMLFTAFLTDVTSHLLIHCMYEVSPTSKKCKRTRSDYIDIARAAFGPKASKLMGYLLLTHLSFYGLYSFILVGNAVCAMLPVNSTLSKRAIMAISAVVIMPSLFFRRLSRVAYMSLLTTLTLVIGALSTFGLFVKENASWRANFNTIPLFDWEYFTYALSTWQYTLILHGILPQMEASMRNPDDVSKAVHLSYATSTLLKIAFGLMGALTFGTSTVHVLVTNDIILVSRVINVIANVSVVVNCALGFPLFFYAVCDSFDVLTMNYIHPNLKRSGKCGTVWLVFSRISLIGVTVAIAIVLPFYGPLLGFFGSIFGLAIPITKNLGGVEIESESGRSGFAAAREMKNKVTNLDFGTSSHAVAISKKPSFNAPKSGRRRSVDSIASSGHFAPTKGQKVDWITKTFNKRECFKFTENLQKHGYCQCGLPKNGHVKGMAINPDPHAKWNSEQCTRRIQTDTFGEIEFAENPSSRKPYIRVSHDTSALSLLKLLTERWSLKVPNLVISVTGGAKDFQLGSRLKEAFSKGLIKAAVSTDAWIITGGTSTGVMQHVGEAVASQTHIGATCGRINCIGIAPWGQVDNSQNLISRDGKGCFPAHYTIDISDETKAPLDINHSHFILVDNGTVGQYGVEIGLRSNLEGAILQLLKTTSQSSAGAIGIPVVILCLEGGPNTIKTMAEAIKKGVPAVVIDGTGRAADVVAFAYKHTIEVDQVSVIDDEYADEVKSKVAEVFGQKNQDTVYAQIEELLRQKRMVSVYRLDDEKGSQDIDLAILRALLKVDQNFISQLKLSLAWNRIDVAKSEIFPEKKRIKPEELSGCMFTALIDNKPDFVLLFLDEGLQMKKFLTVEILCYLYAKLPRNSPVMKLILKVNDQNRSISMLTIALVVEELMGDKFNSRYKEENYDFHKKISLDSSFEPDINAKKCECPWLDLFIWAVLANRRELASLIWERGRENIAAALMASKLLKGLVEKALSERDMVDIGSSLLDHAREWEQVAIGVLDECRKQDDALAQRLVVKELPMFSHLTSLDIAVSAEDQDFIAHPTCQALLNKLWLGAMSELTTHTWQVAVGFFAFPLIPALVNFSGDEDQRNFIEHDRPQSVIEVKKCADAQADVDLLLNDNESDANIGSTTSFKDFEGRESVELHGFVQEDENPINQLVHIDDNQDAINATLRNAKFSYFAKILRFYQAPFVKFFANVVSYLLFLGLYSYMILSQFNMRPHLSEYVLQVWVITLIVEEIRQLITQEPKSFIRKLEWYFSSAWNIADFVSLMAFLTATVLRYIAWNDNNKNYLIAARIIHATDVVIFIIRLLQIFSVNKHLGPKLVMIRRMLHDLKYFIFILAIFIIGYGVAFQAVRFPNTHFGKAIIGVINKPYWQMYGELFIEEILEDPKNCTTGVPLCGVNGEEPCSSDYGKYVAPIYMALYMIFTNILLLNLLIAIFNYTFEKVQDASDKVWKFQRYDLILEYHDRPALSPPFVIISHLSLGMKWILRKLQCCGCKPLQGSSMKFELSKEENEQLRMWEFAATELYIHNTKLVESETLDERVKNIQSRYDI